MKVQDLPVPQAGKNRRQDAIREILNRGSGSSQEDIREYLRKRGIEASQATLSRDLHEMGAVKIPVNGGGSVYRFQPASPEEQPRISNYEAIFESVGNLLIIKTTSGSAPGLCVLIDGLGLDEIAGTIAGDDTIFVVLRNQSDAPSVIRKIRQAE